MNAHLRRPFLVAVGALCLGPGVWAQEPTTVTGRVTGDDGRPLEAASVFINSLNVGVLTNAQGRYLMIVPAARMTGEPVEIRVSLVGRSSVARTLTLTPGTMVEDFQLAVDPLKLEELVVTGAGLNTERQKLGVTINSVRADEIQVSQEPNLVSALAGKTPNVEVTSSSGDPGAGAYIRIRGANSLLDTNQPLFVVDGQPIDNSTTAIENTVQGTVVTNRAMDLNPNDIESVQVLKGAAASAIYGSRAANGVVLITTKSGRPGAGQVQYRSSFALDEVNKTVPLQTAFGQGMAGMPGVNEAFGLAPGTIPETGEVCLDVYGVPRNQCPATWGLAIPSGTPVFDHAGEIYKNSLRSDQFMTWSGGDESTDYYLSLGRLDQEGVIRGNQKYDRTTVRLKASHEFREDLRIGGNFAFTDGGGDFVQQGSNISGIQLGALRTPPDFDNNPYLTDTGLQRTYRLPDPTSLLESRGYDNPYWIANEITNTADVSRTFGNISVAYTPFNWLTVDYSLGADYSADERRTVFPKSSSDFPTGRLIRADIVNLEIDHNLVATGTKDFSDAVSGSLSLGQNLNHRDFRLYQVNGQGLILGTNELDFAVDRIPDEYTSTVRTDGYFAQGTLDIWQQLYLTGAVRYDGSSTFGGSNQRFAYPKVSAAWDFSRWVEESTPISFAKVRAAFGVAGKQPPPFSNVNAFQTGTITDGWLAPNGLYTIYRGNEGVLSQDTLGNVDIKPERTSEYELGLDLAFLNDRVSFGGTYYKQKTTDAILPVNTPPSTGYLSRFANAAEFENKGWEVTLDLTPVQARNLTWTVGGQWATNESCVLDLAGAEEFSLTGFEGATNSVVAPLRDASGKITKCYPIGVFYTDDFVRFGRGSTVDGIDIDATYSGWDAGNLYIADDGYPQYDPQSRVTGDANPDWTASVRNTVQIGQNLRLSALLDVKAGGQTWNGTRGALYFFGTHEDTQPYHGEGKSEVFGETYLPDEEVAGPGAGMSVPINWLTWFWNGIGSGFTGPSSQFIENSGFVKLRDVSIGYTLNDVGWLAQTGFTSIDLLFSARNLKTWTDYTGIDPESNLDGQTLGRGIDYFNNPQTRSWAVTVTLTR